MNNPKEIKPATYLKSRASDLLRQNNIARRPVIITQNRDPRTILQDHKSYEDMRNAIGILKLISQSEQEIREGKSMTQKEVIKDIDHFLKKR